jgi:hypothetical protein
MKFDHLDPGRSATRNRLLDRRRQQAATQTRHSTSSTSIFNPKMNRSLVFDLATCAFLGKRENALFLDPTLLRMVENVLDAPPLQHPTELGLTITAPTVVPN